MIQLTHARVTVPAGPLPRRLRGALLPGAFARDRLPVLHDLTLWLGKGEAWAVLGDDEAAKSALLRLIAGQITPERGLISVQGTAAAALGLGSLLPNETGAGSVRLLCAKEQTDRQAAAARVQAAAAFSGLGPKFEKPVSSYTEAERARLAVAMAMSARPDVLLISDVLERCDLPFVQACVLELRARRREGMTLLLQSTPDLMRRLCESALMISGGELKQLGPFEIVYAALARPRVVEDPGRRKELLTLDKAAFSAPLSPEGPADADASRWPPEARRAVKELEAYADRLNDQLTAYANANLSFGQENERLEHERQLAEQRLRDAQGMLERFLHAQGELLGLLHAQFLALRRWTEPPAKKGWLRKNR